MQASKRPCGPFGTKPARASTFISTLIPLDTDALTGIAMPARVSAFDSALVVVVPVVAGPTADANTRGFACYTCLSVPSRIERVMRRWCS